MQSWRWLRAKPKLPGAERLIYMCWRQDLLGLPAAGRCRRWEAAGMERVWGALRDSQEESTLCMHTRNLLAAERVTGVQTASAAGRGRGSNHPPAPSPTLGRGAAASLSRGRWVLPEGAQHKAVPQHTPAWWSQHYGGWAPQPCATRQAGIKARRHHTAAKPSLLGQSDFKQQHKLVLPSKASSRR